ncbi:MAG: 16S rRNA (adenine(1518)-N(6)/adenine(1519)-N(6))-dimethyltransferase RsmA [Candidatus Hydrothermales bacterium]
MKRKFSQIFLVRESVAREMIEKMNISEGEYVIEVGPGKGILTKILLEKKARVISIEIDKKLCEYLRKKILDLDFYLIEGDFLKINTREILKKINLDRVKLISNVPYHITTYFLEKIIKERDCFSEIYLTLQKEVVERIISKPGTKEYSSLSIFVNFYMNIEILMPLPSFFFKPKPKVNSLFFKMTPKDSLPQVNEEKFFNLVRKAFQERRKKISRLLKDFKIQDKVEGDLAEKRPDQLSIEDYLNLYKLIS